MGLGSVFDSTADMGVVKPAALPPVALSAPSALSLTALIDRLRVFTLYVPFNCVSSSESSVEY